MARSAGDEPRLLLLDQSAEEVWRSALSDCPTAALSPRGLLPLDPAKGRGKEPGELFALAREHAGKFDCILGECTSAFIWHALFRIAGDATPFFIVPRYNHVLAAHAHALLLSSQLALPQDVVFAGSEAAARSFAAFGWQADGLFLPGIDLETFHPLAGSKTDHRAALGLPDRGDLLVYVGRLVDDKGVLELLDVLSLVRRHQPVELLICYHFSRDGYRERCQERARALGGVHFLTAPGPETLVLCYNAADLFVTAAASLFETFGRAPVEAMACGTCPVVPEYDGFRETVPRGIGFPVPTIRDERRHRTDIDGMAAAILAALEDRKALRERAQAAISHARAFDRPTATARLRRRLDGLTDAADSRSPTAHPRLALDAYPPAVRRIWGPLEGQPIEDLLRQFLTDGQIPLRPTQEAIQELYWSWFTHY